MVPNEEITDAPRIQEAVAGNEAAMAELFGRYREHLKRMVTLRMDRRVQGRVDASGVLQEADGEVSNLSLIATPRNVDLVEQHDIDNAEHEQARMPRQSEKTLPNLELELSRP